MWTLPLDVVGTIITCADLGVINAFARSCSALASWVRTHANVLADARADDSARLPNGVLHGIARPQTKYRGELTIEFVLGAATYWRHNTDYTFVARGCNGLPYVLSHGGAENDYHVTVDFDNGDVMTAWTHGVVHHSMASDTRWGPYNILPWRIPVRGYLVDDRIASDVIRTWIDDIITKIDHRLVVIPTRRTVSAFDATSSSVIKRVDSLRCPE